MGATPRSNNLLSPVSSSVAKLRKTSEIVRPQFAIMEETEGKGQFAAGILKEKRESVDNDVDGAMTSVAVPALAAGGGGGGFSFASSMVLSVAAAAPVDPAPPEPKQQHDNINDSDDGDDDDDDGESFITNKMIRSVRHRERRRGSKTTDDIREVISRGLVAIKGSGEDVAAQDAPVAAVAAAPGSRRGSGAPGLARSKSVKIQRVKFGLVPDAQEGETISHPFFHKFFIMYF